MMDRGKGGSCTSSSLTLSCADLRRGSNANLACRSPAHPSRDSRNPRSVAASFSCVWAKRTPKASILLRVGASCALQGHFWLSDSRNERGRRGGG